MEKSLDQTRPDQTRPEIIICSDYIYFYHNTNNQKLQPMLQYKMQHRFFYGYIINNLKYFYIFVFYFLEIQRYINFNDYIVKIQRKTWCSKELKRALG